ncbi:MAG: GNAT family N-acetyltransferase [Alphaproteobacteria bacterium]
MTIAIGPAGPADAAWLAALHARAFPDEPWTEDAFRTLLGQAGVAVAVASDAEGPIGLVLWRRAADEAEILTIGVRPERRSAGIGGRLLDRALAGAADARAVFLEVADDNAAARALYARRGFVAVGRRAGYYHRAGRIVDALVLRRAAAAAG